MEKNRLLTPEEQKTLFLNDMQASGLTQETLNENQIKVFDGNPEELAEMLSIELEFAVHLCHYHAIIQIPYQSKKDQEDQFCRIKLIPAYETKDGKNIKYLQPKGRSTRPYITEKVWSARKDVAVDLFIVEGEKKALLLNQEDFHAIALPGVFNFRNSTEPNAETIELNQDLRAFNWTDRNVFIAFDADFRSNKNVRLAMFELAFRLEKQGAKVKIVTWDSNQGKGIDDYLVSQTTDMEANNE